MTTFAPNEIAILQNMQAKNLHLNGEECTVVEFVRKGTELKFTNGDTQAKHDGYKIELRGDRRAFVACHQLRKKPNPSSDESKRVYEDLVERLTRPMGVV